MSKKIGEIIQELEEKAIQEAQKWFDKKKETIEKDVAKTLDGRQNELIAKLLGFTDHWGRWEIDNCNGRRESTNAGLWLSNKCKEGVDAWLTKQAGNLPKLSTEVVKALRKEYLENLKRAVQRSLYETAVEDAQRITEHFVVHKVKPEDEERRIELKL